MPYNQNEIQLVPANLGDAPTLQLAGDDASIGLRIVLVGDTATLAVIANHIRLQTVGLVTSLVVDFSEAGVNYLSIGNAETGQPVVASVSGTDTDVSLNVVTQGAGRLQVNSINVPTVDSTDTLTNKTLTSPTLTTPVLGVATATSINKLTLTQPATSATLTIPDGVVLTGPAASGTAMTLGNAETVTGVKTLGTTTKLQFTDANAYINATASGALVVSGATSTSVGTVSGTTTVGIAGDISLGDGTLRVMAPQTASKIDLGSAALPFNDLRIATCTATGAVATGALTVTGAATVSTTLGVTGIITSSGGITMADAKNIVINTTTGTKIGTGTTQKIGFWNVAPVVQPSAYTQTYATASKTHTQGTMTDPAAYGAGTNGYSTGAMASAVHAEVIALKANMVVVQNVLNQVIDDLQAVGILS